MNHRGRYVFNVIAAVILVAFAVYDGWASWRYESRGQYTSDANYFSIFFVAFYVGSAIAIAWRAKWGWVAAGTASLLLVTQGLLLRMGDVGFAGTAYVLGGAASALCLILGRPWEELRDETLAEEREPEKKRAA